MNIIATIIVAVVGGAVGALLMGVIAGRRDKR